MEWCLHVRGASDLEFLNVHSARHWETSHLLQPLLAKASEALTNAFGEVAFSRIYFGAEFCEHLIPGADELGGVVRACFALGLNFTLVTPYVTNTGLERLRPLFRLLEGREGHEVIFSDWGVLDLLRREFPRLVPVQGRLLNKSLRDPRLPSLAPATDTDKMLQPAPLREGNLKHAFHAEFLRELGVEMVEIDGPLPEPGIGEQGPKLSVVYPFGVVTTGRVCMAAALGYSAAQKFQPGAPCRHECQTFSAQFGFTHAAGGGVQQCFMRGNTYFYLQPESMLLRLAEQIRAGSVTRVVYEPRMPMSAAGGGEKMLSRGGGA